MKRVYVFDMDNDLIKIGIAADVEKRMSGVSHASGFAVLRHCKSALMSDDEAREIERELHGHFAAYRMKGEFFKLSFEEACDELNERARSDKLKTAVPVNLEKRERTSAERVADIMRQFVKKFCTLDRNRSGVSGVGILSTTFSDEFVEWFNAHSNTFACDKEYARDGDDNAPKIIVKFYRRAPREEICSVAVSDALKKAGRPFYSIYWRQGTPQELVLRQRVQQIRNAFTGLDQRAKDSIIGGFVTDFLNDINPAKLTSADKLYYLFQPQGAPLRDFTDSVTGFIEDKLYKLCGEHFRVYIDTGYCPIILHFKGSGLERLYSHSSHRVIIAHPCACDLDDESIGVYYGSFTQIIRRYCPLEVRAQVFLFGGTELRVRYVGEQAHDSDWSEEND